MAWAVGDVVEYLHVRRGRPWWRMPARVVRDDAELTALWWPAGTTYQRPDFAERSELVDLLAAGTWRLRDDTWWGGDVVQVVPAGAAYAIFPFRDASQELLGWYGNLQAPLVRTATGFETCDWTLDVLASVQLGRAWEWKDEDELAAWAEAGVYTAAEVEAIWAAGRALVERVEARDPIFAAWADWRADPAWTAPTLPALPPDG